MPDMRPYILLLAYQQCCGAGAALKLELKPEPTFLGRLRLHFWQVKNEKFEDINFSLYTSTYFCIINTG